MKLINNCSASMPMPDIIGMINDLIISKGDSKLKTICRSILKLYQKPHMNENPQVNVYVVKKRF